MNRVNQIPVRGSTVQQLLQQLKAAKAVPRRLVAKPVSPRKVPCELEAGAASEYDVTEVCPDDPVTLDEVGPDAVRVRCNGILQCYQPETVRAIFKEPTGTWPLTREPLTGQDRERLKAILGNDDAEFRALQQEYQSTYAIDGPLQAEIEQTLTSIQDMLDNQTSLEEVTWESVVAEYRPVADESVKAMVPQQIHVIDEAWEAWQAAQAQNRPAIDEAWQTMLAELKPAMQIAYEEKMMEYKQQLIEEAERLRLRHVNLNRLEEEIGHSVQEHYLTRARA